PAGQILSPDEDRTARARAAGERLGPALRCREPRRHRQRSDDFGTTAMKQGRSWRSFLHADPRREIDEELKFHLEQRIRDYLAAGMSPEAARRAAEERFGDTTRVRDVCTSLLAADLAAENRRTFVSVSWLDVKLGLRMLRKYPGLTAVAVVGMAVTIAIGAGYFAVLGVFLDSTLPVAGGERIMAVETRTISRPDAGDPARVMPPDFAPFRSGLK